MLVPWNNEEYDYLVQNIEQLVNSLDADVVVIDTLVAGQGDANC
jgi:hypothetical protein